MRRIYCPRCHYSGTAALFKIGCLPFLGILALFVVSIFFPPLFIIPAALFVWSVARKGPCPNCRFGAPLRGAEAKAAREDSLDREFDAFYKEEIHPILAELENERKAIARPVKILLNVWKTVGATVVLIFLTGPLTGFPGLFMSLEPMTDGRMEIPTIESLLVMTFLTKPIFFILSALLAASFHISSVYKKRVEKFAPKFKERVIRPIIGFVHPSLEYHPEKTVPHKDVLDSRLRIPFTPSQVVSYKGEDLVEGRIGETEVRFAEIKSGKDNSGYQGMFFAAADFNKPIRGETFVLLDIAEAAFGRLGRKLQPAAGRGELVHLEDPEFEKHFKVFSDDQVQARYILSTSLMRRLVDYKLKRPMTWLGLSFRKSSVYVLTTLNNNFLEPKMLESLYDTLKMEEYYRDIKLAIGIVEDLNLNRRIWDMA